MYLALYRKYRPRTFDDVISQEHITTTLKNQIISGTTAHAYLFTGSRGTGKTTCAKILAMAMNCLNPKDGNPCLECESCRLISQGAATDIVEMDAASNNGVDDVRQLRDEVAYTPVSCKYRVYIIDEVHMLSVNAFNALLKTIEEPPPHVRFILATTELHKVLPTIVSRCQRFDFRRIDIKDSSARLLDVAEKEGVSLDRDAAELISRLSDGGMRDALSILDRCISMSGGVSCDVVRECAGVADRKHLFAFSQMIAQRDASGCIRLLDELHNGSKDIARIIDELCGHFRDLMLYKTVPDDKELLTAMPDEYPEIARLCELYTIEDILRCLTLLQQCGDNIGKTKQRRTAAEMCLVRMCLGLGAQEQSDARRPASHTSSAPAAATAQTNAAAINFVEIPQEQFKPTPVEELSAQNAANLSKLRALGAETAEIVRRNSERTKLTEPVPPTPPVPVDPAPPFTEDAPDFGAPPPYELAAEPEPIPLYEPPTDEPSAAPALDGAEDKSDKPDKPAAEQKPTSDAAEEKAVLTSITPQQWQDALDKMHNLMLNGSSVRVEQGVLVITPLNAFYANTLSENAQERKALEDEISEALDRSVHIKIEAAANTEKPAEENDSEVNRLLDKARQLNIEVIVK